MTPMTLKLNATVLPGHRLEITAPELPEGANVEVFVTLPPTPPFATTEQRKFKDVIEFLGSLTGRNRSSEEWAAIEREFREERDSWDR